MDTDALTRDRLDDTTEVLDRNTRIDIELSPEQQRKSQNSVKELRMLAWNTRRANAEMNLATSQVKLQAARDVVRSSNAQVVVDGDGAGPGNFGAVGITADGSILIAVDAIMGDEHLDAVTIEAADGARVPRGSTIYFNLVFQRSPGMQAYLAQHPETGRRLTTGEMKVSYVLASITSEGKVTLNELVLNPLHLDLGEIIVQQIGGAA